MTMLSVTSNISSSASSFEKSEVLMGSGTLSDKMSQVAMQTPVVEAMASSSMESLIEDSSLGDSSSADNNNNNNRASLDQVAALGGANTSSSPPRPLMNRKATMKSCFALTDMLQQSQAPIEGDATARTHSDPTTATPPDWLAPHAKPQHSQPSSSASMGPPVSKVEFGQALESLVKRNPHPDPEESLTTAHDASALRQALEPSLRAARRLRDACRMTNVSGPHTTLQPLTSWVGLPYAPLRQERPFLYDNMHTHPLDSILQDCLGVASDLGQLHATWNPAVESAQDHQRRLFAPLVQDATKRQAFQEAYESFVTSSCIPLLHANALQKDVFNSSQQRHHSMNHHVNVAAGDVGFTEAGMSLRSSSLSHRNHHHHHHSGMSDPIVYRYQVFPTINVVYPNDPEACLPPTCDLNQGLSVGWLHFHVPLTASLGSAALYTEQFPGREDWHPLRCTSVGLGYCWDGARCLRWSPINTTGQTRVSLDFRVLLVRNSTIQASNAASTIPMVTDAGTVDDDTLCRPHHLQDAYTRVDGFFEEAAMDLVGASRMHRNRKRLSPDARCGFPFA